MMSRTSLITLALTTFALARVARADSFSTYVASLASPAGAKPPAGCDLLIAPNGEVRRPCALALADLGGAKGNSLIVTSTKAHELAKNPNSWHESVVELRDGKKVLATFRVVEAGGSVYQWVKLITDKDAVALAKAGKLSAKEINDAVGPPPKAMTDETDRNDRENGIDALKSAVDGTDDKKETIAGWIEGGATVLGSSPGEVMTGKAGAKGVRNWGIGLVRRGGLSAGSTDRQLIYGAVQFSATTKDKVTITYNALVVVGQAMTGGGSFVGQVQLASFGVAQ